MSNSKKNMMIAAVLVIVVAAIVFAKQNMRQPVGVPRNDGSVTYACDAGKSFTLRYVDKDTTRVEGPGVTSASLKENAAGYLVNTDGKTTVKQVGSYVVLVQKDIVTHDRCTVKK